MSRSAELFNEITSLIRSTGMSDSDTNVIAGKLQDYGDECYSEGIVSVLPD